MAEAANTFDAADGGLDDFRKAVEAVAEGKLEAPKFTDDETGQTGGNDEAANAGQSDEVVEETAEEKAAKEAAAAKAEADKNKPKKSVSERIAEFRRATTDAQEIAAIEAAESERQRLRAEKLEAELEELRSGKKPDAKAKVGYTRLEGEPDPKTYEFGVIDPAYQRDLTKFFVEADRKAASEASAQAAAGETQNKKFLDTVQRGLEKYDDYLQVVVQGADTGKWKLTPVAAHTIIDSEFGHEIAYHLAKNPDEAATIAELPDYRQAAAIGRLEARFAAEAEANNADDGEGGDGGGANTEQTPKPKNATGAPKPPVRQSERNGGGEFKASPDTKNLDAYRKLVEAHQNKGR